MGSSITIGEFYDRMKGKSYPERIDEAIKIQQEFLEEADAIEGLYINGKIEGLKSAKALLHGRYD